MDPAAPRVRLDVPDRGAGYLDSVFRMGKDDDSGFLIMEAKGPGGETGASRGYEQGHPKYVRFKAEEMANRQLPEADAAAMTPEQRNAAVNLLDNRQGMSDADVRAEEAKLTPEQRRTVDELRNEREVGAQILDALDRGRVRFMVVQAEIDVPDAGAVARIDAQTAARNASGEPSTWDQREDRYSARPRYSGFTVRESDLTIDT